MTAHEQLKTNTKHLDRLNQFLTQDETGILFNQAVTDFALGQVSLAPAESNHGTIFRSGLSGGAARVRFFIDSFDPLVVAEEARKRAAEEKIKTPQQLPSALEAQKRRLGT